MNLLSWFRRKNKVVSRTLRGGFRPSVEGLEARVLLDADLAVVTTDQPDPVLPGSMLTYNISVQNLPPNNGETHAVASNTIVTDALPSGFTLIHAQASQGVFTLDGSILSFSLGDIAPNATASITITGTPTAASAGTTLTNVTNGASSTRDPLSGNNTSIVTTQVSTPNSPANLAVAQTPAPALIMPGQALTYTLNVTNGGVNPALDVSLRDALPSGVTFVGASQGLTFSNGVVSGELGTLAPGDTVTLQVTVIPSTPGQITNTVTVTTSSGDTNTNDNTSNQVITVSPFTSAADLALGITGSVSPAFVGGALTYNLTVTNNGPSAADAVVVTQQLPEEATLLSAVGPAGTTQSLNGTTLTLNLGQLQSGSAATVAVTISPTQAGAVVTSAVVSAATGDNNTNNNDAELSTPVNAGQAPADLVVNVSDSPDPAIQGQAVTYTITVTNTSGVAATNTVVSSALPANTVFLATGGPAGSLSSVAGGLVTFNLGTLAASAAATLTVQLMPLVSGTVTFLASATTSSGDLTPGNNTATSTTTISAASTNSTDLSVTLNDAPDPALPGQALLYGVTITNTSGMAAPNTVITVSLPAGVNYISATGPGGSTIAASGGTVACAIGTLSPGQTTTLTVQVMPLGSGVFVATATATSTVGDTTPANNSATATTTINLPNSPADLVVTLEDNPDPAFVGQNLTWTITVTNNGTSTATGTSVTALLPSGVNLVSVQGPNGSTSSQNGANVSTSIGNLNAGATAVVTLNVVPTGAGTATLAATATTTAGDSAPLTNTATVQTTINQPAGSAAELSVTMLDGPDPAVPGQSLTYSITVTNNSQNTATSTVVTDQLPPGVIFLSAIGPAGSGAVVNNGVLTVNLGNITGGGTAVVSITVMPTTPGMLVNSASVTTSAGDSNPSNNTASATTTINPAASTATDLQVTITDNPDPVSPGQALSYTITITNTGTNPAQGIVLTDTLSSGVAFLSVLGPSGSSSTQLGNTITTSLGTLAPGASTTVTVQVMPLVAGAIVNTATAVSSSGDTNPTNNTAVATTASNPSANPVDLVVTVTDNADPVVVGQSVTYTITVTNGGSTAANAVTLTGVLPTGMTFVSATGPGGASNNQSNGSVTYNLGTLAANASATITVTGVPTQAGTFLVNGVATTSSGETNASNNNVSQSTTVNPANSTTQLTVQPNPSMQGQQVTFTARVQGVAPGSGTPTGTVTFRDGSIVLGTGQLVNGTATFQTTTLSLGAHNLIAQFGGDNNFLASASAGVSQTVNPALPATLTSLTITPGSSVFNQVLTLQATVIAAQSNPLRPSGQVVFMDGTTVLGSAPVNANGVATFGTPVLTAGSHSITAVYQGDGNFSGSPSSATTQTVAQAGPASVGNPTQVWVAQAYRDLLGREAVAADLSFWTGVISAGQSRVQVVQQIEASPEYRTRIVQEVFQQILRRAPDANELKVGVDYLGIGGTVISYEAILYGGDEYFGRFGSGTTSGFITSIYQDVLGRVPQANEIQLWTNFLASSNRQAMATAVLTSPEASTLDVLSDYLSYLRRDADTGGLQFFVSALKSGATNQQVIAQLMGSQEYVNLANRGVFSRYVGQLYQEILKRSPTSGDLSYWTGVLNQGASAFDVAQAIASSPEYRSLQIKQYYVTYLDRQADQGGMNFYLAFMAAGGTFEGVQAQLVGSAEYFQLNGSTNTGFLSSLYHEVLGRPIDQSGAATFTQALNAGVSRTEVAAAILTSTEYRSRLIDSYYQDFLARPADSGGLAAWLSSFRSGARDEQVLSGIISSDEFFARLPQLLPSVSS